jgi:hypothetical protein
MKARLFEMHPQQPGAFQIVAAELKPEGLK